MSNKKDCRYFLKIEYAWQDYQIKLLCWYWNFNRILLKNRCCLGSWLLGISDLSFCEVNEVIINGSLMYFSSTVSVPFLKGEILAVYTPYHKHEFGNCFSKFHCNIYFSIWFLKYCLSLVHSHFIFYLLFYRFFIKDLFCHQFSRVWFLPYLLL